MTSIFIILGAVVTIILGLVLYGVIGWLTFEYGVSAIDHIVLWGYKVKLNRVTVIVFWPCIILAGIILAIIGLLCQLYNTIKKKR